MYDSCWVRIVQDYHECFNVSPFGADNVLQKK